MFSTDFIFRQQEHLVDNQICQAGFMPLCNKILIGPYLRVHIIYHNWFRNKAKNTNIHILHKTIHTLREISGCIIQIKYQKSM